MQGVETFRNLQNEATIWHRYLHHNRDLDLRLQDTARFVAEQRASSGIAHIVTGVSEVAVAASVDLSGKLVAEFNRQRGGDGRDRPCQTRTEGSL